jgi:hypothetical protein
MRTHWDQGKMKKNPYPLPHQKLKGQSFPLAAQNFSSQKEFITIFGLGYILCAKNTLPIYQLTLTYGSRHDPPSLV